MKDPMNNMKNEARKWKNMTDDEKQGSTTTTSSNDELRDSVRLLPKPGTKMPYGNTLV